MMRANGITIDRIMAAGYLSPAVYYAARRWRCYGEMAPEDVASFPPREREELLRLAEDPHTVERLYFLERMDALLDSGNPLPLDLLDELLEDGSSPAVKEYVGALGREAFLQGCVFVAERALSPHADRELLLFIRRYENAFVRRAVPERRETGETGTERPEGEKEARGGTEGKGTLAGVSRGTGNGGTRTPEREAGGTEEAGGKPGDDDYGELPLFSQPPVTLDETLSAPRHEAGTESGRDGDAYAEWTSDMVGTVEMDIDAVPPGSGDLKYVLFLHGLGRGEFEPLRRACLAYFRKSLSQRAYNILRGLGIRDFLMNYLYAGEDKLLTVKSVGAKTAAEINGVRDCLKSSVARMYRFSRDASGKETGNPGCPEAAGGGETGLLPPGRGNAERPAGAGDGMPEREFLGPERYGFLKNKLEKLAERASGRTRRILEQYRGDFIEDYVLGGADPANLGSAGVKAAEEIKAITGVMRREMLKAGDMTEDEAAAETAVMTYGGDLADAFALNYKRENGHLPMLRMLEKYFEKKKKGEKHFAMLDMVAPFKLGGVPLSCAGTAGKSGITPASVRFATLTETKRLSGDPAAYGPLMSDAGAWDYLREKARAMDIIYADNVRSLIGNEPCGLHAEYLLCLLNVLLKGEYVAVGRNFFETRIKERSAWTNVYLVSKTLADRFDMASFRWLVEKKESGRAGYLLLTVDDMLSGFMSGAVRKEPGDRAESVREAARLVLRLEMGKEPDGNGRYALEKRGRTLPQKAVRNMLEEKGAPMTIDEVYSRLCGKFPGRYESAASIIPIIRSAPDITRLRYTDLIALSKWKKTADLPIRGIIARFLSCSGARETADIVEYVKSHRPDISESSVKSVLSDRKEFVRTGRLWTLAEETTAGNAGS